MLAHRSQRFDSLMTANPALYISMRNQLVPSMAYTLTYSTIRPGAISNDNVHNRTIILGANKAYLEVPAAGAIKGFTFSFGGEDAIRGIENDTFVNGTWLNLAGQRVNKPSRGVYIIGGKKVIVK